MTSTVYRIRNKKTGQFYSGGASGCWTDGSGATYEKIGACKCVWSMRKRYDRYYSNNPGRNDPAEIVAYTVTEIAGKTEDLK
jgi:hypothetical protein